MWQEFLSRLLSRKFLLAVAGIVGFVLLGVSGAMPWAEALDAIMKLILGYIVVEGAGDALGKFSYYKTNKE